MALLLLVAAVLAVPSVHAAPAKSYNFAKLFQGFTFYTTTRAKTHGPVTIIAPVSGSYLITGTGYNATNPSATVSATVSVDGVATTRPVWFDSGTSHSVTFTFTTPVDSIDVRIYANTSLPFDVSYTFASNLANATVTYTGQKITLTVQVPSGYATKSPLTGLFVAIPNTILGYSALYASANAPVSFELGTGIYIYTTDYSITPTFTLVVVPVSPGTLGKDYTLSVEGFTLPSGVAGVFSTNFAATHVNGTLTASPFNSTLLSSPAYGTLGVAVYGHILTPHVYSYGGKSVGGNAVKLASALAIQSLKYYKEVLVLNKTAGEYWNIAGLTFGNLTLVLSINGTNYTFDTAITQDAAKNLPYWTSTVVPFTATGSASMVVNDTAKAVYIKWYNVPAKDVEKYFVGYDASVSPINYAPKHVTISSSNVGLVLIKGVIAKTNPPVLPSNAKLAGNVLYIGKGGASVEVWLQTSLTVNVKDAKGNPVAGATVNIYDASGTRVASKDTDKSGSVSFTLIPAVYTVEVVSGSEVQSQTINLGDDTVLAFTVTELPKAPIITVDVALLALLVLAAILVVLVAIYVLRSRSAIVVE